MKRGKFGYSYWCQGVAEITETICATENEAFFSQQGGIDLITYSGGGGTRGDR